MNLFTMPPMVSTFYNDNQQVLFVLEGAISEPDYKKLSVRYNLKGTHLELLHNDNVIGIIGNIKMAFPIMESKVYFIGWMSSNGLLSKEISLDKKYLFPL